MVEKSRADAQMAAASINGMLHQLPRSRRRGLVSVTKREPPSPLIGVAPCLCFRQEWPAAPLGRRRHELSTIGSCLHSKSTDGVVGTERGQLKVVQGLIASALGERIFASTGTPQSVLFSGRKIDTSYSKILWGVNKLIFPPKDLDSMVFGPVPAQLSCRLLHLTSPQGCPSSTMERSTICN